MLLPTMVTNKVIEEGLQDFVFELYQEEVTINSKFCWPELEAMDCQTLFVCQRDHDNEDEGKHTGQSRPRSTTR